MTKHENDVLGTSDVANEVGVSVKVVHRAFRRGNLRGTKIGGRKGWVTTRSAMLDWVESGNRGAHDEEEA